LPSPAREEGTFMSAELPHALISRIANAER
jgi:hypothetical protein